MKKILFGVFFLMVKMVAYSQNISVEKINTDVDVLAFVKQENYDKDNAPQWNHFYLTDGTEWNSFYNLSKEQINFVTQNMQNASWQKLDLNHDGKADLMASGYIARRPKDWNTATFKLLVFLSQKGNGYVEMNLIDDELDKFPTYFNAISMNGNTYPEIFRWCPNASDSLKIPLETDTLNYNPQLNTFVNYVPQLYNQPVKKIDYLVLENEQKSYHGLSIEKADSKRINIAVSLIQQGLSTPSVYKARMTPELWSGIDSLVRSLRLDKDSTVYFRNNDDDKQPIKTTIYFADGSKKTITYFTGNTSFSLMALYQAFEEIINDTYTEYQQRQQHVSELMNDFMDW